MGFICSTPITSDSTESAVYELTQSLFPVWFWTRFSGSSQHNLKTNVMDVVNTKQDDGLILIQSYILS